MNTVYKYEIDIEEDLDGHDCADVEMPVNALILAVGNQGKPYVVILWALVATSEEKTEFRKIAIVGTGNQIRHAASAMHYLGIVFADPFVWHVFEVQEETIQ